MTHHVALWLVGPPGVGKTSVVRKLLGFPAVGTIPKPKWTVSTALPRVAAGWYSGATFDGADTVPYNGADEALAFWRESLLRQPDIQVTIFDGDRFSNQGALKKVEDALAANYHTFVSGCVHLKGSPELLAARRKARGSNQNEVWLKGRETKAARFAELFTAAPHRRCYSLDATPPVAELSESVEAVLQTWAR